MKNFFFFLLLSTTLFSQKTEFKGKLLDAKTKEPIAYANISFLNSYKGISSNEDGTFSLSIENKDLITKVHISCLNFKDTVVVAKEIQNKKLYLIPNSFVLDEVFLKKDSKEIIIDKVKKRRLKNGFSGNRKFPWIITKYIKYKENYYLTPFLKSITIHYATLSNHKAKFRIRIYENDNEKPGNDLTSKSIIVTKSKKDRTSIVNLYDYNIQMPKNGLFIGLERINIPYNFYYIDDKKNQKFTNIGVSPVFGSIRKSNAVTWFFQNGNWQNYLLGKHKDNSSLVPAISLTLSD